MITLMKAVFASCVALCTALTPINAEQVTQLGNGVRNIQFVDEDGDGICDNYNKEAQTTNPKQNGIRKADGTGNANGKNSNKNNYCRK